MKTDQEQMRLIGPIQGVRLESADFHLKEGTWVEGQREPIFRISFDEEGNKSDEVFYCEEYPASPAERCEAEYDAEGNALEKAFYQQETLQHRICFTYDENNNLIKEVGYFADGSINYIALYEYDSRQKQTAMKYFKSDGTPDNEYRYTNEYDEVGNLIKKTIVRRSVSDTVTYDQPLSAEYYIFSYR